MEIVQRIFYRKINPSDFKKLYDLDRPLTGGGQTYLEAAGIPNEKLVDFLSIAEMEPSPLTNEDRLIYKINAITLGGITRKEIEFAPRGGRINYRISRQNMRYKHPAWSPDNGFPEPNRDQNGQYQSSQTFRGIIDNLVILIIRTSYNKYYAGFINSPVIPPSWPTNIGLESIFTGERRGVLDLEPYNIGFRNNLTNPFDVSATRVVPHGAFHNVERISSGLNILLYGVPGSGKSYTIENEYCDTETVVERIVFHPDYTYSDFVGQILPNVSSDGQISYEFTPGPFTTILESSHNQPSKKHILIIEEINRGNAPAIFGETFQLLDRTSSTTANADEEVGTSEYGVTNVNMSKVIYDDPNRKVKIPSNLTIIGTMNTSDQNVFTLDTAFQRRWNMRLIPNDFDSVDSNFAEKKILDTDLTWQKFCTVINDIIITSNNVLSSAEDKRLGVYFVRPEDLDFAVTTLDGETVSSLKRKKSSKTITEQENAMLSEFLKADAQNRKFPEKVIKYLWDDVFKFNRDEIFNTESFNGLEGLIANFMGSEGNDRFNIFSINIREELFN